MSNEEEQVMTTRFRALRAAGVAGAVALAAAAGTASAPAHQTTTNAGVSVTLHVNPNDEPVAGAQTPIHIVRIRTPKGGKFSYRTCGCRLLVQDSSGATIFNGPMGKRATVVFPREAAYRLTYSGAYRKGSRTRRFRTTFSVRAVPA